MKRKLNAYRGRLTAAQVAEGMNAAAKNARRLSEDAERLLAAGSFPTAASLAALAIEEWGKVSILRQLAVAKTDAEATTAWKSYRTHTSKNAAWMLPQLFAAGARKFYDFAPLFDKASDHPFLLDQLKQLGFYTDCLGDAHWVLPWDLVDEPLSRLLVKTAELFARDPEHTEREVALWVEHMGPVWNGDRASVDQALVNYYGALQAEGLAANGPNVMEQFIQGHFPEE